MRLRMSAAFPVDPMLRQIEGRIVFVLSRALIQTLELVNAEFVFRLLHNRAPFRMRGEGLKSHLDSCSFPPLRTAPRDLGVGLLFYLFLRFVNLSRLTGGRIDHARNSSIESCAACTPRVFHVKAFAKIDIF